jgi:hypothetical protein
LVPLPIVSFVPKADFFLLSSTISSIWIVSALTGQLCWVSLPFKLALLWFCHWI